MSTDPLRITNDEDWLHVELGETCVVIGKLGSIAYGGQPCLLVSFSDWSQLVISVDDASGVPQAWMNAPVRIRCERDENGLIGKVIWQGYHAEGVPVPLCLAPVSGDLT